MKDLMSDNPLWGKRFVITGMLSHMQRSTARQLIERLGGLTSNTPVDSMDVLVVGYLEWSQYNNGQPTRKILKAEQLQQQGRDIQIIGERDFYELLIPVAREHLPADEFQLHFGALLLFLGT